MIYLGQGPHFEDQHFHYDLMRSSNTYKETLEPAASVVSGPLGRKQLPPYFGRQGLCLCGRLEARRGAPPPRGWVSQQPSWPPQGILAVSAAGQGPSLRLGGGDYVQIFDDDTTILHIKDDPRLLVRPLRGSRLPQHPSLALGDNLTPVQVYDLGDVTVRHVDL